MKTYGGVDVWTHVFLTTVLVGGEWSASGPGRFTPGERAPGIHWIGGWVGPELICTTWRIENSCLQRNSNSDTLVIQPEAGHCTDCATPAHII
jgi:hypothetical protein